MALGQEVGLDRKIAIDAAYIPVELKMSMADSTILATCSTNGQMPLVFKRSE